MKTTQDFFKERQSQGQNVGMINLGCARNLVDSQTLLGRLKKNGNKVVDVPAADVVIVNTCSFIEDAKKESIDTIIDLLELKKKGKLKKVIVAGCLAQRYGKELAENFKDIDAIVGAQKLDQNKIPQSHSLTPSHYAYVKICESCYNRCSFCIIPKLKGKFTSRTMESVIEEVKLLDAQGVKEINLIGQDITAYGMDLYHELSLAKLLKKLVNETKNIKWIRLLYAFPAHVTDELIDVIAAEDKICNYIDIPLQHISNHILKEQNRNITEQQTVDLIKKMQSKIKNASIRTTFIVGLPGETEQNFTELSNYVKETRFQKMGAFVYSHEEGTKAYLMEKQVSEKIKHQRMHELMSIQKKISQEALESMGGRTLQVLVDDVKKNEDGVYLGRTEYDAPEVDGIVYIHTNQSLNAGDFVRVKITGSYEYDLVGELA